MNRIYSKVWNPSLGMLVVASEFARRAHGVMSSGARVRARLGVTLLASALLAGAPLGAASAHDKQKGQPQNDKPQIGTGPAYCVDARGNPIKDGRPGENAVSCGDGVDASGRHAVAVGYKSIASKAGATAVGGYAEATGVNATAVGYDSSATAQGATALGSQSNATVNALMVILPASTPTT